MVTQRTTPELLAEWGIDDVEPGVFYHYTMEDPAGFPDTYIGMVSFEVVTKLDPSKTDCSYTIRHHADRHLAHGYIDALMDLRPGDAARVLFETKEGLFTLAPTPLFPCWPGPVLRYFAEHPADNIAGWETWMLAIGPNGEQLDPEAPFRDEP